MTKIILFASGSGSNAENIIEYFKNEKIQFYIFSNNPKAFVLDRAQKRNIPTFVFSKEDVQNDILLAEVQKINPHLIVLAGYLWMFPANIIALYPNKIINIHPALLPKYGGKGMYGMKVHQAVVDNQEKESGISIHYVNEAYDEGAIIYQAKTEITPEDTADDVAQKIHALEYQYFPKIIESLL